LRQHEWKDWFCASPIPPPSAHASEIETKITAEEVVRDVTYNDLNQPMAADPEPEANRQTEPTTQLSP
jgi:hypothetical protein